MLAASDPEPLLNRCGVFLTAPEKRFLTQLDVLTVFCESLASNELAMTAFE
jgi:hypothetical protein